VSSTSNEGPLVYRDTSGPVTVSITVLRTLVNWVVVTSVYWLWRYDYWRLNHRLYDLWRRRWNQHLRLYNALRSACIIVHGRRADWRRDRIRTWRMMCDNATWIVWRRLICACSSCGHYVRAISDCGYTSTWLV
jgi:hypothetical protein